VKNSPRLAGIRNEIAIHVRRMSVMNWDERQEYLESLIGPKTSSASEADVRALLMTRLRELQLWPRR
jgi:hypothetical protein